MGALEELGDGSDRFDGVSGKPGDSGDLVEFRVGPLRSTDAAGSARSGESRKPTSLLGEESPSKVHSSRYPNGGMALIAGYGIEDPSTAGLDRVEALGTLINNEIRVIFEEFGYEFLNEAVPGLVEALTGFFYRALRVECVGEEGGVDLFDFLEKRLIGDGYMVTRLVESYTDNVVAGEVSVQVAEKLMNVVYGSRGIGSGKFELPAYNSRRRD